MSTTSHSSRRTRVEGFFDGLIEVIADREKNPPLESTAIPLNEQLSTSTLASLLELKQANKDLKEKIQQIAEKVKNEKDEKKKEELTAEQKKLTKASNDLEGKIKEKELRKQILDKPMEKTELVKLAEELIDFLKDQPQSVFNTRVADLMSFERDIIGQMKKTMTILKKLQNELEQKEQELPIEKAKDARRRLMDYLETATTLNRILKGHGKAFSTPVKQKAREVIEEMESYLFSQARDEAKMNYETLKTLDKMSDLLEQEEEISETALLSVSTDKVESKNRTETAETQLRADKTMQKTLEVVANQMEKGPKPTSNNTKITIPEQNANITPRSILQLSRIPPRTDQNQEHIPPEFNPNLTSEESQHYRNRDAAIQSYQQRTK